MVDYVDIIQDRRTIQPFEVIKVNGSEIKDYEVFGEKILKPSLTAIGGETLKIRQKKCGLRMAQVKK